MLGSVYRYEGSRGRRWRYIVDLPPDPRTGGRRQKRVSGFLTRKAAEKAMVEFLASDRSVAASEARQSVREYLETWLSEHRPPELSPTTWTVYESIARVRVMPRIGGLRLEAVTTKVLRDLYRSLAEPGVGRHGGGLSPHSIKHTYTFVNLVLEDAVRLRVLKENPNKPIPRPKFERRDADHWTPTEAAEFLARTRADELWPAWVLLLTTGMRRGEILGLRWSDIDGERGAARVRRNVVSAGYHVHEKEPKTATGRRSVALDSFTLGALTEHRVRVEQRAEFVGRGVAHDEPIFLSAIGEPIHPMSFSRLFRVAAVRAGVRPISVKDGRHTSATLALVANTHPKVVSERLGHSDVQITMDVYSHVIEGLQRDAAEGIAALLRPPPGAKDNDA